MSNLPPLTCIQDEEGMKAHFFSSYASWLVPNRIMVGESPAVKKDCTRERIQSLCNAGCRTFVCLQSEVPPQTSEAMIIGGFEDWKKDSLLIKLPSYYYYTATALPDENPAYVHYGMRGEGHVDSLDSLNLLIENLKSRIYSGEVLYIHCDEGNGRTNLVAAGLLARLYSDISTEEALKRTHTYYEMRCQGEGKKLSLCGNFQNVGLTKPVDKYLAPNPESNALPLCLMPIREESKEEEVYSIKYLDEDRLGQKQNLPATIGLLWSKFSGEENKEDDSMELQDIVDQKSDFNKSYALSCTDDSDTTVTSKTTSDSDSSMISFDEDFDGMANITSSIVSTTITSDILAQPLYTEFSQPYHSGRVQQIKNKLRSIEVQFQKVKLKNQYKIY